MQLKLGRHIHSADGRDIGAIRFLILDPIYGRVKTFVVEKGWFLPDDIEIPLDAIEETGGEHLVIRYTAAQVQSLPRFDKSLYAPPAPEQMSPWLEYPTGGLLWPIGSSLLPLPVPVGDAEMAVTPPPEVQEYLRQQDEDNVVISAGDEVLSQEGQKIGEVKSITFDSATGQPTHLTLHRGWLFPKEWNLPADVIASVEDGVVTLKLDRAQLQSRLDDERYATEWSMGDRSARR